LSDIDYPKLYGGLVVKVIFIESADHIDGLAAGEQTKAIGHAEPNA
jgi:hypothetical protein